MTTHTRYHIASQRNHHRGAVLVLAMIFITIFAAFAVSLAAFSNANVQSAENLHNGNCARTTAESGLEMLRFLMKDIQYDGTITTSNDRITEIYTKLTERLQALADDGQAMSQVHLYPFTAANPPYIYLNRVNLDQKNFFYGTITQMNDGSLQAEVRGYNQQAYPTDYIRRTLRVNYAVEETANTVFDFGVASKGPLSLQGNILVTDVNVSVEMNAYIESYNDILAFSIQNSQVGGEVKIVNPLAMVSIQGGHASVGGESGSDAMKHIKIGEKAVQFPKPDPTVFSGYAQTPFTDSSATGALIVNRRIPPNTNPKFSGTTTIRGVMYIEQPNVVEFAGGVDITGVIVTDGSRFDDSGANKIIFGGSVGSASVSDLPDEAQYAGLHKETGTFIMAPGFALSFTGSFGTLSGAIIGNGITFSGSAGGTIKGSVINYANNTMELTGSTDLFFNRSGLEELPAGFVPEIKLVFKPDTYSEPMLSSIGLVGIEG